MREKKGRGSTRPERVELADGRQVWIRPVRPSDIDELRRAIREADPETLRMRFLGGRPPSTDAELRRLVELDHRSREAVAAFTSEGRGVGVARYETVPDTRSAEFAVAVDREWRRVGLASALLTRLLRAALRNGITTVHVEYLAGNRDVADLVRRSGGDSSTQVDHDVVATDVSLESLRPNDPVPQETGASG